MNYGSSTMGREELKNQLKKCIAHKCDACVIFAVPYECIDIISLLALQTIEYLEGGKTMTPYSTQALSYDKAEEDWNAVIEFIEQMRNCDNEEVEEDSSK